MHREMMRVGLGALLVALLSAAPSSATLELPWFTIDGGGATELTAERLTLGGTAGQPDAGLLEANRLQLRGGFWLGGEPASGIPEPPDAEEPGVVAFRLQAGVPNPFVHETLVYLDLPEPRPAEVLVLDPSGRAVRQLCDVALPAGRHRFAWDGTTDAGERVASGAYLLRVRAGGHETHRNVILMR